MFIDFVSLLYNNAPLLIIIAPVIVDFVLLLVIIAPLLIIIAPVIVDFVSLLVIIAPLIIIIAPVIVDFVPLLYNNASLFIDFVPLPATNTVTDPNTWTQKAINGHKVTITGLTPGVAYNFTAAYKGSDDEALVWAPLITKIVSN